MRPDVSLEVKSDLRNKRRPLIAGTVSRVLVFPDPPDSQAPEPMFTKRPKEQEPLSNYLSSESVTDLRVFRPLRDFQRPRLERRWPLKTEAKDRLLPGRRCASNP